MGAAPVFASVSEAMEMVQAGLAFVAAADATELTAAEQAECLRSMERANSLATAARTSMLGASARSGDTRPTRITASRAWLMHQTGITKGAAVACTAWVKRAAAASGAVRGDGRGGRNLRVLRPDHVPPGPTSSRPISGMKPTRSWPMRRRREWGLRDLAGLAAEILARCRPDQPTRSPDQDFDDRSVKVQTTFQGAGIIHGDLTPECAAVVQSVLDALAAPAGAEDERTKEQRYHDALAEGDASAGGRGAAAGAGRAARQGAGPHLPGRPDPAGRIPAAAQEWIAYMRARWAAHRAAASETGSDGGAWLDGKAAGAAACDASITPVVTGDVDLGVLDELVRLCVHLDRLRRDGTPARQGLSLREVLEQQVIGSAVALLSGPGGLAGFLRRRQLGTRLGGRSLPLDVGVSTDIPAAIRRAVIERDQHCQFPSGCDQPAAGCEVHHLTHKADGGKTSVQDCALFCFFHHQVVIHRWGWTVVLNPDGTTTAWNKDKTKILHSHSRNHSPPPRPG